MKRRCAHCKRNEAQEESSFCSVECLKKYYKKVWRG